MVLPLKSWWKVIVDTITKFFDENSFQDSAAIAFYTIFSLPGIAIISVMIASGFFYGDEEVKSELLKQVTLLMGDSGAKQIERIIQAQLFSGESVFMKIVGFGALFFSATTVMISLQDSLNKIWHIKPKPKKKFLKFVFNRLLSLAFVSSLGFIILVSLALDTLVALLKAHIYEQFVSYSAYFIVAINFIFAEIVAVIVFASIYKLLPDLQIRWRDVWLGAIVTTILFTIGKYLISYYLSTNNFDDAYGAAASLVALLAWVYYSMLILFFGAQFTYVYTKYKGRKYAPGKDAVVVKEVEVNT